MRLKEKVAVITGGGRGIGAETGIKYAQEGAKVVLVDLNQADLDATKQEIMDRGGVAEVKQVDVTSTVKVEQFMKDVYEKYGRIDILVNNAGITADGKLLKMEEKDFDKVIDVNLKGVFVVGKAAARYMKEQNSGVILNASSVVGVYGNYGQTNYAATKFGVIGMTKTWAKELGRYNVRVNAVAPGFIVTPMTEMMPEKVLTMMKEKSPISKLGTPEDIANAYVFLASDEARFITGAVLNVDGGVVL